MALNRAQHANIIAQVLLNHVSFASLGRKYGVSREYIRQIAVGAGITGRDRAKDKREAHLREEAEFLIEDRELFIPPRWAQRPYSRAQFEVYLEDNSGLLKRWKAAQALPLSNSGHANPQTQRCTDCKVWKFWNEFYADSSRVYGYSSRCQECAKDQAKAAYHAGREAT